ncbi:MAG: ComF family protein [Bacteroidales bacterium]
MKKMFRNVVDWGASLLELFFPRICAVCGKSLFLHEKVICTPCLLHLPETGYHHEPDNKAARMFWGRIRLVHCSAYLHYRKGNSTQKLIHQLKYKGRQDIGEHLGKLYGRKMAACDSLSDVDGIIPVPLHWKKERRRGYNQSLAIAKGISAETGKPLWTDKVVRRVYNVSQTTKDRFGRWENARERFSLKQGHRLEGKHVLLVDDVITTGATIEALAEVFNETDGVRISVVSIGCAS